MNEAGVMIHTAFVLPPSLVSKADVSRLVNEMERVDNELMTASVRTEVGVATNAKPVLSQQLRDFIIQNKLVVDSSQKRSELIKQLRLLKDAAPVIHMTFAVTADTESLQQIVGWLRTSVHRQAVISTGLQPNLVAGVYMRTPNHVYDMSLRAKLRDSRSLLLGQLEALRGGN